MGKTPLPKDEALQPLNVKVPMEDLYFLQEELKPAFGVSYNAEADAAAAGSAADLVPAPGLRGGPAQEGRCLPEAPPPRLPADAVAQALRGAGRARIGSAGPRRRRPKPASGSRPARRCKRLPAEAQFDVRRPATPLPGLRPTCGRPLRASRASPFARVGPDGGLGAFTPSAPPATPRAGGPSMRGLHIPRRSLTRVRPSSRSRVDALHSPPWPSGWTRRPWARASSTMPSLTSSGRARPWWCCAWPRPPSAV